MSPRGRPPRDPRAGFTLVELLVVVLIVGILAGLALPRVRTALHRADAARVISDVSTIGQAALTHLTETGQFPAEAGIGAVPSELAPRLPDDFSFTYKDATYRWIPLALSGSSNLWGTQDLGIVFVYYPSGSAISKAMQSHSGTNAIWTQTFMLFLLPG